MTPVRAALAGAGFIGTVHAETLRRLGTELCGVFDLSPEAARRLGAPVYGSYDALLADDAVDVVHLATPNHLHFEQARAALAAGKHVVCEKPLALTTDESAELVELAESEGRVGAVCFVFRGYPQAQQLRALRAEGALGQLHGVHGSYLQDWLLLPTDWNWRLEPELGGALRAVGDIGSHWLDLAMHVAGAPIESVCADLATVVPVRRRPRGRVETFAAGGGETEPVAIETEDAASVLLRFAGGARGCVTISQVSAGRKNALSLELDGAAGAAAWCSERPEELWLGHRDRANELLLRDPALLEPAAAPYATLPAGHAEGFREAFGNLFAAVYRTVGDGAPAEFSTFADGHRAMLVGDAVARSAREGGWVDVAEPVRA